MLTHFFTCCIKDCCYCLGFLKEDGLLWGLRKFFKIIFERYWDTRSVLKPYLESRVFTKTTVDLFFELCTLFLFLYSFTVKFGRTELSKPLSFFSRSLVPYCAIIRWSVKKKKEMKRNLVNFPTLCAFKAPLKDLGGRRFKIMAYVRFRDVLLNLASIFADNVISQISVIL